MQETSAPGAAVAGAWWERSLGVHDERAERYAAFARVLRFPESVPVRSIRVLSGICAEDPVAGRALAWVQNVPDATSLALEHMRLFGGFGVCGATDCLVTTPGTRKRERGGRRARLGIVPSLWLLDRGQHATPTLSRAREQCVRVHGSLPSRRRSGRGWRDP